MLLMLLNPGFDSMLLYKFYLNDIFADIKSNLKYPFK